MFHCLPNVIETVRNAEEKNSPNLGHNWGRGGRPRWKVVTLSSVFFFDALSKEPVQRTKKTDKFLPPGKNSSYFTLKSFKLDDLDHF